MQLSATIITLNEARKLRRALTSLQPVVDEIIVIDSGSTDATETIAREFTNRFIVNPWPGYAAQKNFAAAQASHDWILSLDADECLSEPLQQAIQALKPTKPQAAAFQFPRLTFYLGRWIKHAGWYPDYKIRLYDRRRASWHGQYVHESIKAEGQVENLSGDLLHYSLDNLSEHVQVVDRYTTLAAQELAARRQSVKLSQLLLAPPATFLKSYLLKQGFRDGFPGLCIAGFAAYYVFLKHAKLWELQTNVKAE